ncbi:hypothetical protein RRG08_025883 [Elysia crispata]|uniref:Uncharacterized protein n=1 Tax=Elysia crispata TaxID=231223 RepID=A0AAE0ZRD1_9GAST|nr:hypothetical protein RRG08_025883 [Elysia crispata]
MALIRFGPRAAARAEAVLERVRACERAQICLSVWLAKRINLLPVWPLAFAAAAAVAAGFLGSQFLLGAH